MKELLKKIMMKSVLLFLVLAVPIVLYMIIEDDVQMAWNINSIKEMNKYIIAAEFSSEHNKLSVTEKVEYINKTGKELNKLFFYLSTMKNEKDFYEDLEDKLVSGNVESPCKIKEIKSIKIDDKKADFKLIGMDRQILMINLDTRLKEDHKITVEIEYDIVNLDYAADVSNGKKIYILEDWYPIIAEYNGRWILEPKNYNEEVNYYFVEIIVPEGFEVNSSGRLVEKIKKKGNYHFKFYTKSASSFNVNIISTK